MAGPSVPELLAAALRGRGEPLFLERARAVPAAALWAALQRRRRAGEWEPGSLGALVDALATLWEDGACVVGAPLLRASGRVESRAFAAALVELAEAGPAEVLDLARTAHGDPTQVLARAVAGGRLVCLDGAPTG